jgi:hypothetical protein
MIRGERSKYSPLVVVESLIHELLWHVGVEFASRDWSFPLVMPGSHQLLPRVPAPLFMGHEHAISFH